MKFLLMLIVLACPFLATSCDDDETEAAPKPTFVFVHGTFADESAWQLIKPKLEQAGYSVVAFNLPAHGTDPTPVSKANFELYVSTVVQKINAISGKVVLLGHSMGGMVVTQVAEQIPAKIEKLVYLCAFLPKNGQTLYELASSDTESLLGRSLHPEADGLTASLPPNVLVQVFAVDAPEAIQKEVAKTRPEPLAVFAAKASLTDANFGKIPKYYIKTLKDEGVTPTLQQRMIDGYPGKIAKIYTMNTSHSPYWAKPDELVTILKEIN
ncbi:alpha/beta fold hydrolase [Larkinella punicea]|uniref:Alpha/beta fold hydrolase n=1 Tax=Larkinella punicea TaxID=2315727 RepID=A0A368JUI4_9BACT|nr:alpha/beta fold hydrolase [Larkinella punicea]RCR71318.1 alpha/beta fold hydrolase [Larkinella punicea]